MPATASTGALRKERYTKTYNALSTMQHTAPSAKDSSLHTFAKSYGPATLSSRIKNMTARKTLKTGLLSMRSQSGQQQQTSTSWQITSQSSLTRLAISGSSTCLRTPLTPRKSCARRLLTISSLPANSLGTNTISRE